MWSSLAVSSWLVKFFPVCCVLLFFFHGSVAAKALDEPSFVAWSKLVSLPTNIDGDAAMSRWFKPSDRAGQRAEYDRLSAQLALGDFSWVCDYPARADFIASRADIDITPALRRCTDLDEFLQKVPFDSLSVVFASEQLNAPASVMGHSFLKIEGKNAAQESTAYAISFLTNVSTINFPNLALEILLTGREGYVTLGPYGQIISDYVDAGERSVWEVEVPTSPASRRLAQLHIWELRNARPEYLFIKFNCATFLDRLLYLASPQAADKGSYFLTPLDLYKNAAHAATKPVKVTPARQWIFRSLDASLTVSPEIIEKVLTKEKAGGVDALSANDMVYALALNEALFADGRIDADRGLANHHALSAQMRSSQFDPSNYWLEHHKSPLDVKPDSQVFAGFKKLGDAELFQFGYLPAARQFMDNREAYFAQQENLLSRFLLSVDKESGTFRLEDYTLVSLKSILPNHRRQKGFSFAFDLSARRFEDIDLTRKLSGNLSAAFGGALSITQDVVAYALVGGGMRHNQKNGFWAFGDVELGITIDQVFESRGAIVYSQTFQDHNRFQQVKELKYDFQKDLFDRQAIWFSGGVRETGTNRVEFFGAGVKHFF